MPVAGKLMSEDLKDINLLNKIKMLDCKQHRTTAWIYVVFFSAKNIWNALQIGKHSPQVIGNAIKYEKLQLW